MVSETMEELVSLCKRRGFIFQSNDIYGGIKGLYDYGPMGIELKNNLKQSWWKSMIYERDDIEGLDASILTMPDILKYSDYIIVTSDSINMISETATIPAPLFVYYFPKETGKIIDFLDNLVNLSIVRKFDGRLFEYKKSLLDTNSQTILKINKFLRSKYFS